MNKYIVVSGEKELEIDAESFGIAQEGILTLDIEPEKEHAPGHKEQVAAFSAGWWSSVRLVTK